MTASRARPSASRRLPFALLPLALLAGAALGTAAVSLHTINGLKDVFVLRSLHGQEIGTRVLLDSLGWADAVLALVAAAFLAAMATLEWRVRAYSRLLMQAGEGEALCLLLIVAAWLGHCYLGRGVLLGGDTGTHIARFLEVSRGLGEGRLAQWTNYQYAGAPLLWFTGPLTYLAGGVLTALTGSALLSTKALLFVLHLGSAVACFVFLRRLGFRPVAAVLAASGFAGAFAHLHLLLYRGVIPQAFTIVFLVLLFHAADALLRGRGSRAGNFALFALSVAAMIVNHQPHALFAAVYLAVFAVPMFGLRVWRRNAIPVLAAAGLAGVVAGAVAVLPVLAEADWVMIEPDSALFRFHLPTARRMLNLLQWNNTRTTWGIDYWAYLGLGTIGFGVVGAVAALAGQLSGPIRAAALGACLCLPLCLVLYNPVVRDVIFLLFFASMLAAFGLEWLISTGRLQARGLLVIALVVLADLASTSIQPVARNDKGFLVDAGRRLERLAPGERVMEVNLSAAGELSADIGPDGGPQSYSATIQRIAGNHNMAASRLHNFLVTSAKLAEADLRTGAGLSADATALLGLFNVSRVICHSPIANGCPAGSGDDAVLGRYIAVRASPILFSTRLTRLKRDPGLEKPMLWVEDFDAAESRPRVDAIVSFLRAFLRAQDADVSGKLAGAIPIADECDPCAAGEEAPPPPVLRAYRVGLDRVELAVDVAQPGFLQLAHPWFPSTVVTVNGQITQPLRGALDLLVVPVHPGTSLIELRDRLTPARTAGLLVSLVGLLLIALGALLLARLSRPAPSRLS